MSQYFLESYEHSDGDVKVELDLFCYATKSNLKVATDIDPSMLVTYLAGFETKVGNLNVDKLKIF